MSLLTARHQTNPLPGTRPPLILLGVLSYSYHWLPGWCLAPLSSRGSACQGAVPRSAPRWERPMLQQQSCKATATDSILRTFQLKALSFNEGTAHWGDTRSGVQLGNPTTGQRGSWMQSHRLLKRSSFASGRFMTGWFATFSS